MSKKFDKTSIKMFDIVGVPVRVHSTYIVFVVLMIAGLLATHGSVWAVQAAKVLAFLFACVLVHELGHAAAAISLGHKVRDVTIYPIGGLAAIETKPGKDLEVAWIAFAGPAANFVLFAACSIFEEMTISSLGVLSLILGASNLLPIKSFDGGVILKCLLNTKLDHDKTELILFVTSIFIVGIVACIGIYLGSILACVAATFMFIYGVLARDEKG